MNMNNNNISVLMLQQIIGIVYVVRAKTANIVLEDCQNYSIIN